MQYCVAVISERQRKREFRYIDYIYDNRRLSLEVEVNQCLLIRIDDNQTSEKQSKWYMHDLAKKLEFDATKPARPYQKFYEEWGSRCLP
jgi:hypothetical protein